mmetsp:Transcript_8352/g.19765  ORF Transcript_8352/g.19765 Transcript_8352/m.19765 type:complete len:300 (+) Transcript_8352:88-987(+)
MAPSQERNCRVALPRSATSSECCGSSARRSHLPTPGARKLKPPWTVWPRLGVLWLAALARARVRPRRRRAATPWSLTIASCQRGQRTAPPKGRRCCRAHRGAAAHPSGDHGCRGRRRSPERSAGPREGHRRRSSCAPDWQRAEWTAGATSSSTWSAASSSSPRTGASAGTPPPAAPRRRRPAATRRRCRRRAGEGQPREGSWPPWPLREPRPRSAVAAARAESRCHAPRGARSAGAGSGKSSLEVEEAEPRPRGRRSAPASGRHPLTWEVHLRRLRRPARCLKAWEVATACWHTWRTGR